ncbi:hypothetical protein LLH06_08685 [Mucilaginibacter daejeonensis]|uniref:hypothetical protein n=1 Tax=Mucilaginibacter daejeonensis TaxID=398049 RepID=UPI001D16FE54|nr:hypothetical protein [Mucilaginibacter daejeonensis]UEG55038.1 hypothetical protein LLH06_08685 [Mucilaginibacter daejeonensis]
MAEPIEHLSNFHAFHQPIANLLTLEYDTGDQAQQLVEELSKLSPEAALIQLEEIGNTPPNLIRLVIDKQPEPVRQLIKNRQEAMKGLLERYYNWSLEELQQHRLTLNKDLLLQNTEIRWTPEKIVLLDFSAVQLQLLYQKGRFDNLSRLLFELEDEISWNDLCQNYHISWTENLLDKYAERIAWNWVVHRTAFNFEKQHIQKYQKWFDRWHSISSCHNVNWSIELIRSFENFWSWYNLSINPSLPWTTELFETFEARWDYHFLSKNNSFCWSNDIIDRHINRWSWSSLAENTGINWNQQLIEKYVQKWDRFKLFRNAGIQWTETMIRHFSNWFDQDIHSWCNGWTYISLVDSPWKTPYLVSQFESKWHWWYVAKWQQFDWCSSFIEKYADRLFVYYQARDGGIGGLCENSTFPWTETLIREKAHVINYTHGSGWNHLSSHPRLPMNIPFLKDFVEKLSFSQLSSNISPNFNIEIVRTFPEKHWAWKALSDRQDLLWSPELLEEFKDRWDWQVIAANRSVYEKALRPLLNKTIFTSIMTEVLSTKT